MPKLQWSDELLIGVKEIDNQHKELIRIANGLLNAISLERDQKTVDNVLKRLREYTIVHFNSEEEFMEKLRYSKRAAHAKEHQELKYQVKEFQRKMYLQENLTAEIVLDFLKTWLLQHILQSDREISKYLRAQDEAKQQFPSTTSAQ